MDKGFERKGYLREDYRLFYLKKMPTQEISYHYHDFHKVLLLLDGHIGYGIEGRTYDLVPGDVVLVGAGQIHAPLFYDREVYERLILYLSPDFESSLGEAGAGLLGCFDRPPSASNLLRLQGALAEPLAELSRQLVQLVRRGQEETPDGLPENLEELYRRMKVTELLLLLDRSLAGGGAALQVGEAGGNEVIRSCIGYIAEHLGEEDLSIDTIAGALYLSRSYVMHRFKEETGCTVGEFIRDKRLFLARNLLNSGLPVTEACFRSGFRNYSAFYYAYKKKYHTAPTQGAALSASTREE